MATTSAMTSDFKKLSFAKVAASATKENIAVNPVPRASVPATTKDRREKKPAGMPATTTGGTAATAGDGVSVSAEPAARSRTVTAPEALATVDPVAKSKIVDGLKDLAIEKKAPSLVVVDGAGSSSTERSSKTGNSQTPSDEASQKADSSSELGTKPPSLDGKSITSGTTFNALDEKESLRPDDSASVKAAAEDDDAFSVRGSLLATSRMGSEVAVRVQRLQIGDMPPRTITQLIPETHVQGVATPHSVSSEQPPAADAIMPLAAATSVPDGMNGLYGQNPDEKLLEAMQSQKDRLFLLRLESEVVNFVQNSKEPFMDLPPSNSFCRMLTHKLADYYHMTHSFEAVAGSVRIYRTPFCRVPPPLASIAAPSASNGSTPPPILLPKKIMRRGEDGEFASASAGPSKPTSEAGSDAKDKTAPAKEKLSREAREEAYNKARERIFGSALPTESSTPENENSAGVSRASSVSAQDRSNLGKRGKTPRQRRDDSESFDSRSQYTAYYGHPQQPTWVSPQYIPVGNPHFNAQVPQPTFANPMQAQPVYGAPNPGYQPIVASSGFAPPPAGNMQQPAPQPRYPPTNSPLAPPYVATVQPAPQQPWQPGFNQGPYPPRAAVVPPAPAPAPALPPAQGQVGIPYAFGQLPVNVNPNDPKSQHPIPGSYAGNYNRHAFNPKTQSFVPGTGAAPLQPPPPGPYTGPSQLAGPPIIHSQMPYNGYAPTPVVQPTSYGGGGGGGYGMMRQGSSNSIPPYPPPQQAPQPPVYQAPPPYGPPQPHHHIVPQNPPPHIPSKPAIPQGPAMAGGQPFGHLPNYGNPATLPQKPST